MGYDAISALRVDLYTCEGKPSTLLQLYKPKEFKNYAWIPQTMGDQIWVLYEFENTYQRIEWEKTLPSQIAKYLDRGVIEAALHFGWSIRNANGFIVG